ncbi:MAG: hypothetical protein IKE21_03530 [Erysipelotrichaceae bacterium]|nr:hypothetical protein [Erysipelotrichaceae bacterium]
MKYGIKSTGAYLPYRYLPKADISKAWGGKGGKGEKSVADVDEDSITMAVEAALGCFRTTKRSDVDALYFATTTAPYAEKQNAALISVACDLLDDKVFTADVTSSTRAGTNALRLALDSVKAGSAEKALVTAAETRNGFPKSAQEAGFGDAAAAVVVAAGEAEDLLASVDFQASVNEEINDYWRNADEKFVRHAEKRFCDEEGYLLQVGLILKKVLQSGYCAEDFAKVVLVNQGNPKLLKKLLVKNGIAEEKLVSTFTDTVGDSGAAQALLGLVNALENAEEGEKILLVDYGNGASAFVLTVQPGIKDRPVAQIAHYLATRAPLDSYARFLSWRGIATAEPGTPYKVQPSWAQTWREQRINLRLHGSVCKKCGSALFPINRVCDCCGSKDEYEEFSAQEEIGKLYTFSIDEFAGQSDDPVIIQAVAEVSNGAHIYTLMTDFVREEVKVDMDVEFTFRRFNELGNFPNYFWKIRPVRREVR